MRKINLFFIVTVMLAAVVSFGASAFAAPYGKHQSPDALHKNAGRMYGKGAPFVLEDLPPQKHLRKSLENLPKSARSRAMHKLHTFTFPAADLDSLQVDPDGGVFYSDGDKPVAAAAGSLPSTPPPVDALKLHSRPGAANTVFLDFDGHVVTGTAWNSKHATLTAAPYDIDGNPNAFNNEELNGIHRIWHRIAEDFAPFDIDVTTEEPEAFGPKTGHIVFTKNTDTAGLPMPSNTAGGIAYIDVFGAKNYASYRSPAFVYYDNLYSNVAYMAESGAHEFGHNLGLSHDGSSEGSYYAGLGTGNGSWAPIMGSSFYASVSEWSKGEYPDANNKQDDIGIIADKLSFGGDDHGNTLATAGLLAVETDGRIFSTTPEDDPGNVDTYNKGIIEKQGDIDMFAFDSGGGTANLTITPAWAAFTNDGQARGANLDIKATLYDASGAVVAASDPLNDTKADLRATLAAGRYYLAVTGVGNADTPYSAYGSAGEFFISGAVPPPSALSDTTPPSNPAWQNAPVAQSANSIAMASTVATDASGVVEYRFVCVAGGKGCIDSAWQRSPAYVINGLAPNTAYTFKVIARDAYGNQSPASQAATATTPDVVQQAPANTVNAAPLAMPDVASARVKRSVSLNVLANDTDANGDKLTIVSVSKGAVVNGKSISYKGTFPGEDTLSYTVSDGKGATTTATVTVVVTW